MAKVFSISFTLLLLATVVLAQLNPRKQGIKSRVFNVTQANESLVISVHTSVTLRDPFPADETNFEWYLNRGDDIITIYENKRLEPTLSEVIRCSPTEERCEALIVSNLTTDLIGEYGRVSRTKDRATFNLYHYLITGYQPALKVDCVSNKLHACIFNATSKTLVVREDQDVQIFCTATLWKYSTYDSPTEIRISGCNDDVDTRKKIGKNYGLYQYELSTKCAKRFSKTDGNLSCTLQYSPEQKRDDLNVEIDEVVAKLDVEFGPITDQYSQSDINKVTTKGKDVALKCPFSGNPIQYFWKELNAKSSEGEISGAKEFVLSRTLSTGKYEYECRAEVSGSGSDPQKSEVIKFQVTINDSKKSGKSKTWIIVGAVIGGVLALALIIIVAVVILRGRKKGSEKPKPANRRPKGQSSGDDEDVTFRK